MKSPQNLSGNPSQISKRKISLYCILLVLFSVFITLRSEATCNVIEVCATYGSSQVTTCGTTSSVLAIICVGQSVTYSLSSNTIACLNASPLPPGTGAFWFFGNLNCPNMLIPYTNQISCTYTTPGTYTVHVRICADNGEECVGTLESSTFQIIVHGPPSVSISSTPDCPNAGCNGTATANVTGTPPYSYLWSNGQTTGTATGLCAGTYTVTVTDANGCGSATGSVTVTQSTPININILNQSYIVCNNDCDGHVSFEVSGGTEPYNFSGSTLPFNQTVEPYQATGLCGGNYTIMVTDANGCTASASVIINQYNLVPTITGVAEGCAGLCDGMATVGGLTGLISQYSFSWLPGGQTTQTITDLCSDNYTVTVRNNTNGCTASLSITLKNEDVCERCNVVHNDDPQTRPVADQDCWWSTGGNSRLSVGSRNQLGTTDKIPLRFVTNNTEQMRIEKDGNIGINTLFPLQRLHVNGSQLIDGPQASLFFGGDASGNLRDGEYGIEYMDLGGCSQGLNFWKPFLSHNLSGNNGFANYILFLNDDGNVGIGVDPCMMDPDYKLSVCGKIRAHGITVESGWCDFVFNKNYKLRTLKEVEDYIYENKRLPEFPAGDEIEKEGADLGILLAKQMQKIEELTLYLIQQNKEIEDLKMKLNSMEK